MAFLERPFALIDFITVLGSELLLDKSTLVSEDQKANKSGSQEGEDAYEQDVFNHANSIREMKGQGKPICAASQQTLHQ